MAIQFFNVILLVQYGIHIVGIFGCRCYRFVDATGRSGC